MLFWKKKEKNARYITTTLPYVNDDPHIGHALEFIQTDVLARYWRLMGYEVFFNTGTDEHGQKILQKATEKGEDVKAYVDFFAERFKKLNKEVFNLSFDRFIRTTDNDHIVAAQELWKRCADKGDIYKKKYKGLYCVGDEMFLKEGDLVEGKCPNHPNMDPIEIEEENYFFRLSNYQKYLEEYLSREGVIVPEWRRQEALNFVKGGLEDFSISREKARMNWGVPVPEDDNQVMYVWFDALTNYISTLGWPGDGEGNFKKFWENGETLQMAGKDQVRFQSIMWQAMLKSAGIRGTDRVFYHGFINSAGRKMSKSLGNVISPFDMVDKYGLEATRYILLRHAHPFDDSDFTWERMDEWYTANLANGLGNLTARIMKMAEDNLPDPVPFDGKVGAFPRAYELALNEYQFQNAADLIFKRIKEIDERIALTEPFKVVKKDKEKGMALITELVSDLYEVGALLRPFMPETATKIMEAVKENKKPETLFARLPESK